MNRARGEDGLPPCKKRRQVFTQRKNDMELKIEATVHLHQHGGNVVDRAGEILCKLEEIMSAISDFASKVKAHQDAEDAAIAGLTGDVQNLNAQIAALQTSQGTITAADQKILDDIEARGQVISDKLAALDALTPPVAPPTP